MVVEFFESRSTPSEFISLDPHNKIITYYIKYLFRFRRVNKKAERLRRWRDDSAMKRRRKSGEKRRHVASNVRMMHLVRNVNTCSPGGVVLLFYYKRLFLKYFPCWRVPVRVFIRTYLQPTTTIPNNNEIMWYKT